MDAPTPRLTREQIDTVIEAMSAADLIKAIGEGKSGSEMAAEAFDKAAARLGMSNGTAATEHVGLSDFAYLADRLNQVVNIDAPKPKRQRG